MQIAPQTSSVHAPSSSRAADAADATYVQQVRRLCSLSARRLPKMIDAASGLVVFRVDGDALRPAATSFRYTAMTALGVERALKHGLECHVDHGALLAAMERALPAVKNSGDLGLALWSSAGRNATLAQKSLSALLEFGELVQKEGHDAWHATELGWVVTGLCEALGAGVGREREVKNLLDIAWRRLLAVRGRAGLFAFARPVGAPGPFDRLRSELGFFDAQVYGMIAALRYDELFGSSEARDVALTVGRTVLRHQRPLGQWAWHYNARTGGLVDLYPVYSVHQDGMAPMALIPLERRLGLPTREAIAKGVRWMYGENELGVDMADDSRDVIWRSIRRRGPLKKLVYPLKAASLVGAAREGHGQLDLLDRLSLGERAATPGMLEIDREFRPYHLGWCLYAFSELAAAS